MLPDFRRCCFQIHIKSNLGGIRALCCQRQLSCLHQDLLSGCSWKTLDIPSTCDPVCQDIGKIWKGMILRWVRGRCLSSELECLPEESQAFDKDIHPLGDSPCDIRRWSLLSPFPRLNLMPEDRNFRSMGYPLFLWKKYDCEVGKKRPGSDG